MNCFYFPQLTSTTAIVDLHGDEARHIVGARRLKVGDELLLFNGKGLIANAEITDILKNKLNVVVTDIEELNSPVPRITLATAIPKGDRINVLLDMSTQLGITDFVPLVTERSIVELNMKKFQRFNRICINACKQSRRFFVPKIHASTALNELLDDCKNSNSQVMVADPGGQPLAMSDLLMDIQDLVLLVGPEGGFSESEVRLLADHDVLKLKLSDAILRIETACVSLLSQINCQQMS